MSDSYLDELETIKDFGFKSFPIQELSMLLAIDLCSARVISLENAETFIDLQIPELTSNKSFIDKLAPHISSINKKIIRAIDSGDIQAIYLRKDFETGALDVNNTLISLEQFQLFLEINNLDQHILWTADESALGLRVDQEEDFFYQAIEKIRLNKKYVSSKVMKAEIDELYLDLKAKVDSDPEIITQIIMGGIEDYIKQREEIAREYDSPKPINIRTENNYLRLIMALANEIRGFNPKKPFESAQIIIEQTDIDLSQATLASYISKAYELQSKRKE